MNVLQNVTPNSLMASGIISPITVNGRVKMANEAVNKTNEKLAIGIQLYVSTFHCHDFISIYTPNVIRPDAVPMVDKIYKN